MTAEWIVEEIGDRPLGARLERIDQTRPVESRNIYWSTSKPTKALKLRKEPKPPAPEPKAERVKAIREAFRPRNPIRFTMCLPDSLSAADVDWV
jgi:hypothetical protein